MRKQKKTVQQQYTGIDEKKKPVVVTKQQQRYWQDIDETGTRQWWQHATEPLAPSHCCGWYLSSEPRKVPTKPSTKWNISFLFYCWLGISSVDGLHLWLLDTILYKSMIGLETVEKSWDVFIIYRDLLRKIQYFCLICVIGNLLRIRHWRWYKPDKNQERMLILNLLKEFSTKSIYLKYQLPVGQSSHRNIMKYYFNKLFKTLWVWRVKFCILVF